jgi:hypothetical protein
MLLNGQTGLYSMGFFLVVKCNYFLGYGSVYFFRITDVLVSWAVMRGIILNGGREHGK